MKKIVLILVILFTNSLFAIKLVSGILNDNSIIISWQIDESTLSRIYYRSAEPGAKTEVIEVLPEKGKYGYKYRAILKALKPSTRYNYWVEWGEYRSSIHSFTSSPKNTNGEFHFLAYGDTQYAKKHEELAIKMSEDRSFAFTLHTGDLNEFPFKKSWDKFFDVAAPLLEEAPMYPVYGNHEMSGSILDEFFELPNGGSWYSFDFGKAHFIALDTTKLYPGDTVQTEWLRNDLEKNFDKSWKIVFFHHPPFSPFEKDSNTLVREKFLPLFEEFGVHLVLSGHSHVYNRYQVKGIDYIITGGGGGNLLTGGNNDFNAPFHYLSIKVSKEKLLVTAIRLDGSIADTFIITNE